MKIIIRFPNKKLTPEERDKVADTFKNNNFICVDQELELWQINDKNSVTRVFGEPLISGGSKK